MTAREIVRQLVELGEQERRLITAGQLEKLAGITEEREQLVARLDDTFLPDADLAEDDELRDWISQLESDGRRNLALLESLKQEMARRIESGRSERRAATTYEKNRSL